jgi:Fic family protein
VSRFQETSMTIHLKLRAAPPTRTDSRKPALREFFDRNPNEWLTINDAAAKVTCAQSTAERVLQELIREGVIERVSVYRLRSA